MLLGVNAVNKRLNEVLRDSKKIQTKGLIEIGETGVGILKLNTPVDEGRLRNSMSYTTDGKSIDPLGAKNGDDKLRVSKDKTKVFIGTNVIYAPPVEFLAKNGSAGYMLRSYKQLKPRALKIMKATFSRRGF